MLHVAAAAWTKLLQNITMSMPSFITDTRVSVLLPANFPFILSSDDDRWMPNTVSSGSLHWFPITPNLFCFSMIHCTIMLSPVSLENVPCSKFHLARYVASRHDTFDVSSASRRACRAVLFDKLDTAKMYGLDTSNVLCRVEMWRDEPREIWAYFSVHLQGSRIGLEFSADFEMVLNFRTLKKLCMEAG